MLFYFINSLEYLNKILLSTHTFFFTYHFQYKIGYCESIFI